MFSEIEVIAIGEAKLETELALLVFLLEIKSPQQMKLACPISNKRSLRVRFDQQVLKREEERKKEKMVCATL